ncbi:MAG: hypothetical protein ABIS01_00340, partial [Ferruginibacter sp.]
MAKYNDVLGVLREYRNQLEQSTQIEVESQFTEGGGLMSAFSARGGVAAFSTPLSNIHATGVGIRMKQGKIVKDEYVIKVYVYDKMELDNIPELTKAYNGIAI